MLKIFTLIRLLQREINSSFAKLIDDRDFELIFNINANEKVYFNNISLDIPDDFDINNFNDLNRTFADFKKIIQLLKQRKF